MKFFRIRRFLFTSWPVSLVSVVFVSLVLAGGCTTTKIPMTDIKVPMVDVPMPDLSKIPLPKIPLLSRGEEDLRYHKCTKAFEKMEAKIAREYPFTEWKGVNWPALHDTFAPRIAEAQKKRDRKAYYLALREFMYSVPDGHMRIEMNETCRKEAIGAGYGFSAIRLDDGRVIAHVLLDGGAAARAGMTWGAEILEWNQKPIAEAIAATPVYWADTPPATAENRAVEQCLLFTRASAGEEAVVTFRNTGGAEMQTAALKAEDDKFEALNKAKLYSMDLSTFESPVQSKVLPGGYGYLRVYFLSPTMTTPFPAQAFQNALDKLIKEKVTGIILDVRGNTGGDASLAPKMAGHFVSESAFYQDVALLNDKTGAFQVSPDDHLSVERRSPVFNGPVAVLIDYTTIDAGEGIPLALKDRPQTQLVGIYATNGSFGITGGDITMPQDYVLSYPVGRSLDAQGNIQVDGNAAGAGGVAPQLRIPLTEETVRALFVERRDLPLEKAVEWLAAQNAPKS